MGRSDDILPGLSCNVKKRHPDDRYTMELCLERAQLRMGWLVQPATLWVITRCHSSTSLT